MNNTGLIDKVLEGELYDWDPVEDSHPTSEELEIVAQDNYAKVCESCGIDF